MHDDKWLTDKEHTFAALWSSLAVALSTLSKHPTFRVGCVIVSRDNTRVLGVGYNGDDVGGPNTLDSDEPGKSGFVHAEVNAIVNARTSLRNSTAYVTNAPCPVCARTLINAGVKRVIFIHGYRDKAGLEILERARVEVYQVSGLNLEGEGNV